MGSDYLQVAIAEDAGTIELPKETDGTLLLTTLSAQFPGVTGLKFRSEKSGGMIGVRLANGRFHVPETDGWRDPIYYCEINKVKDTKRKLESEEEDSPANKKIENKFICQRRQDLVVLDLPWKTTETELRDYFEGFGDLVLAQIKKDLKTGQSKGYGFIRFSSYDSQVRVLGQRHFIQGRWCDVKIPKSKKGPQRLSPSIKVHVGRLTEDITENDLHEYFSSFGEVTHVFIPNKPFRGFAFVSFLNADVAQSVCGDDHVIKNISVTVAVSNPRPDSRSKDSSRRDGYDDNDEEPYSREQNSFGSGKGQGMVNIRPQVNQAIVSAVLNQVHIVGIKSFCRNSSARLKSYCRKSIQLVAAVEVASALSFALDDPYVYVMSTIDSVTNHPHLMQRTTRKRPRQQLPIEWTRDRMTLHRRYVINNNPFVMLYAFNAETEFDPQLTEGMQGQCLGQMQQQRQQQHQQYEQQQQHQQQHQQHEQQQYGGSRNSSPENIWETSYPGLGGRPLKRDSHGRMLVDY